MACGSRALYHEHAESLHLDRADVLLVYREHYRHLHVVSSLVASLSATQIRSGAPCISAPASTIHSDRPSALSTAQKTPASRGRMRSRRRMVITRLVSTLSTTAHRTLASTTGRTVTAYFTTVQIKTGSDLPLFLFALRATILSKPGSRNRLAHAPRTFV
ncbi:hypothetical protein PLICRDRAFT_496489 [Plicaturopsis crispa FD-325 SS-3]|nr:hypothetical protein PLICRDRAFT_496489 [Plicaturopsis crispa FD-325 SS-3]